MKQDKDEINKLFENFLTEAPEKPTVDPKLIEQILEMSDESPKDQFLLLGSISNYHKYGYPSLKEEGGIIHVKNITYAEHVFYDDKFSKTGLDGERIQTYIPPSPRNRIMYFMDPGKEGELLQLVKHILKGDQGNETDCHTIKMEPPPVPRKKRKHSSHLVSVSQHTVFTAVGADISTQFNCANPNRTLYKLFEEQLITEGIIKWRLHEQSQDFCIMNDIKLTTGHLMPQSFVHVECTKGANDEEIFIQCTCDIYNLIQRAAHQESHILPGEDVVLDENFTCMHCRFLREHLLDAYTTVTTSPTTEFTRPLFMVHESLQHMNDPVQLVGNVISGETTRFSGKGKEGLSIVHISFYQGNVQILCTDGHCAINFKNKKNITRRDPDHQYTHVCSHLHNMFINWDSVKYQMIQ